MGNIFSDRIADVPRSFIREILKLAIDESVISFAGGLPNRDLFPVAEIKKAAVRLLDEAGGDVLQYSSSEGYRELREWIADRYRLKSIVVHPDNILITTGSQQGMDLLGKTLLNDGDSIIIEEPGYLGAIQAFSIYKARFHPVPVSEEGIDLDAFHHALTSHFIKLFYCVPNFQNPSGVSYSENNRQTIAHMLRDRKTILVEDDPYGELRFLGREKSSFYQLMPEQTVLLGSFSKTVVPSFRIGWIVANDQIMEKLVVAKQASDLHTNYFGQRIIHQYLSDNDIDEHINKIRRAYGRQRDAMVTAIREYFPAEVLYTHPEGGMFLWITLPEGMPAMEVFKEAIKQKVAFVPGDPFYVNKKDVNTLRLNYSSVDEDTIRTGIQRLGTVLKTMLTKK
ncbi:MAG: PLP-dependent aminotransferase family protein [Nitrospirae bacterium]|nr:PLP-dependent aminotransferase family protein [Nitrospirota bacterium]